MNMMSVVYTRCGTKAPGNPYPSINNMEKVLKPNLYLLVGLNLFLFVTPGRSGQPDWIRRTSAYLRAPSYEPFVMELIGSDHDHLFGTASYRDYRSERLPVAIDGSADDLGRFWPHTSAASRN